MADFVSLDGYNVRDDNAMRKVNPTGTGYLSINRKANTTIGTKSVALGNNNTASGSQSYAEGSNNVSSSINSHAEGSYNIASGIDSHAEGNGNTASGVQSHAEGYNTTATAPNSHAEGTSTLAKGDASHAEGSSTHAEGVQSHAEGDMCWALGINSHVEGYKTRATHKSQHVYGEWNELDTSTATSSYRGNYVEIVGNGSAENSRSNARTLDWSGNETIAGTLTQNSDARLKVIHDTPIPDLSTIGTYVFNWLENTNHDDKDHIGYIAQDVEAIAPYLVREDANGYKSLDYIAVLVAKVAALEARVRELETNAN